MTVQTETNEVEYTMDGVTLVFAIPFRWLDNTWIKITRQTGNNPAVALATGTDYTLSGVRETTGSVTLVSPGTADDVLLIYRDVPITQGTVFRNRGAYDATNTEDALDKLTMATGQLSSALETLEAPDTFVGFLTEEQTATAAQTVFVLTEVTYTPGLGNIGVYINGVRQHPTAYSETSSSVVTLSAPGAAFGDKVLFEVLFLTESAAIIPSNIVTHIAAGSGAVTTTVRAKLRETVSVKDFGATGDGTTDDTAAIQAAITANGGKVIYFPAGTYKLTAALTITSDDTRLVGDGSAIARYSVYDAGGVTALMQTTVNTSTVKFEPALSTTQYLYGVGIEGMSISYTTAAATTQTSGTGVTFTRCNGYVLNDVTVNDAFEAIAVKGGYDGRLRNFRVTGNYIDRAVYPPSGYNGLVTFKSSSYNSIYQGCQVVSVSDFAVVQGKVRNYTVIIESADGVQFSNGYIGNAVEANVLVRPTVDGTSSSTCDYVSAVAFSNVYIDGVQTTATTTLGAKRCVTITNASGSYLAVYDVTFGAGCYFANAVEDLLVVDYTRTNGCRITVDGTTLSNATNSAVVVDGPNASSAVDLMLSNSFITTVGEATYGAVKIGDVRSLIVTGNHILTTDGCALYLLGTINNGIISNNYNNSTFSDVVNVATVTGRLTYSGNGGAYTGANTWRGFNPGNIASASTDRLDWYQEGTFTPALTFSGGTTGITYTSRSGDYTRIGNVVYVRVNFLLSSKGSDAGQVWITALPYSASSTGTDFALSVRFTSVTAGVGDTMIAARLLASGTTIFLEKLAAGARVVLTEADLTNSSAVTVTGMYFV